MWWCHDQSYWVPTTRWCMACRTKSAGVISFSFSSFLLIFKGDLTDLASRFILLILALLRHTDAGGFFWLLTACEVAAGEAWGVVRSSAWQARRMVQLVVLASMRCMMAAVISAVWGAMMASESHCGCELQAMIGSFEWVFWDCFTSCCHQLPVWQAICVMPLLKAPGIVHQFEWWQEHHCWLWQMWTVVRLVDAMVSSSWLCCHHGQREWFGCMCIQEGDDQFRWWCSQMSSSRVLLMCVSSMVVTSKKPLHLAVSSSLVADFINMCCMQILAVCDQF